MVYFSKLLYGLWQNKQLLNSYCIYLIRLDTVVYIGSTNDFERRMSQHLKDLRTNAYCNDKMQEQWNYSKNFHATVLEEFNTLFPTKVLKKEQRYINQYSNANEATASKNSKYSWSEFLMDIIDTLKG